MPGACRRTATAPTATGCTVTAAAARPTATPGRRAKPAPPPRAPAAGGPSSGSARISRWRPSSAAATATARAVRHWIYRDAAGSEAFRILRIDYRAPDGTPAKSYRPCHKGGDGRWLLSRPALPLPLYNLPAILAAPPKAIVAVLEGEKCTDIAAALGLPYATTSAHGAQAPQLTDWSPLAGRSVAILRDAGDDGAGIRRQGRRPAGRPRSPRPRPHRRPCPACPTARTSSNSSTPAAPPAAPTPTSSPSCVP